MSLEMAQKVIVPQQKIMSRSFLNSSTLIVITYLFGSGIEQIQIQDKHPGLSTMPTSG
jgi:hypothetical protein